MGIADVAKSYLTFLYKSAEAHGETSIEKVLSEYVRGGVLLDVGCWDGNNTIRWSKAMKASAVIGLELFPEAIKEAKKKGIKVYKTDIGRKWPIKTNSVDCVTSNLVIEHMSDVDFFISESYRVLKKGGFTVVATNNLSSWHNIISLLLGWAPFDLTNTSRKRWSIGNPLAIHTSEERSYPNTYMHKCVYTARWIQEWYELYKFKFVKLCTAGYYPFPNFISNIDRTHSALMTLLFKK